MLENPLNPGFPPHQQPHYQPVIFFTYWTVLGSFKNWNITTLSHKAMKSETFEEIHQVVLYGNSDNMNELVQSGKSGAINTTDYTKMGYYVIIFLRSLYPAVIYST